MIKPVKQKYCFNCLTLRNIGKKKLTMNSPPPILPIHGKGGKINVKIQDDQKKIIKMSLAGSCIYNG